MLKEDKIPLEKSHNVSFNPNGLWVKCGLECGAMFFRHDIEHKYFGLGDKLGICPLCLFSKKMVNGTLKNTMRNYIVDYYYKSIDSKPEKDSL